ncbi:MAG: hypothetical protein AAGJ08_00155 [Cyanobacteria bacterium P01_H01_bin.35]
MKVIGVDNFDRDYVPEKQITLSLSEETAKAIADLLNKGGGDIYYRVVDDDYELNYDDMHDVVGEKMTFNSYIAKRNYSALPKYLQTIAYKRYVKFSQP